MSISYHSFRVGEGKQVVFQHGLAANSDQIVSLLGGLDGIDLIGIDCPGHGKSLLANFVPSFDHYADLLIKHLDGLGIEQVCLGGLSMGSGIALNICLRYPERVSALILHRPAWLDKADPSNLMILKEATTLMGIPNGEEVFKTSELYKTIAEELPATAQSVLGIFSKTQQRTLPEVINRMVGDCPFVDMEQLSTIDKPCLVIANDDDPLHPFWMAEKICNKIKNSELKKVTSRYIDNKLHQQEVQKIIGDFVRKLN